MSGRYPLLLAARFLGIGGSGERSNARRSLFGSMLGIGLSLVPLVVVLVVSDGMIEGITSRLVELGTSHVQAVDYSGLSETGWGATEMRDLADRIVASDSSGSVVGAWAERQGYAIVVGPKGRGGSTVRAVDEAFFAENRPAAGLLEATPAIGEGDLGPRDILLGKKLADSIGAKAGDTVRVVTMARSAGGRSFPRFSSFVVRSVFSSGYQELDGIWCFIALGSGYRILDPVSSRSFVNVSTVDAFADLSGAVAAAREASPEGFSVFTWADLNRSQFTSFRTTKAILLFIMFLIVLVACANVSSALVMLVLERRREIAILKSAGAPPGGITFSFLLAGFLTGLGGALVGVPTGIFLAVLVNERFAILERAVNVGNLFVARLIGPPGAAIGHVYLLDPAYYLERIPVTIDFGEIFFITSGTLVLSVCAALFPAIRAGRERPIDTLRKV